MINASELPTEQINCSKSWYMLRKKFTLTNMKELFGNKSDIRRGVYVNNQMLIQVIHINRNINFSMNFIYRMGSFYSSSALNLQVANFFYKSLGFIP